MNELSAFLRNFFYHQLSSCHNSPYTRHTGITDMYLRQMYTIVQMMHVSGHKTRKTFMDYIKLSGDEIADEIDAIANPTQTEVFWLV